MQFIGVFVGGVMSKAVEQFTEMVCQTYAWLVANTTSRVCQICDAETKHVVGHLPGWTQYRCVECGFQESIQKVRQE
jgi:hypothetical protein